MKTVIRASFPFMTNSWASSECAKHLWDQLSNTMAACEAHPQVPEDTVSLKAAATEINEAPTFLEGLTLLQKQDFQWTILFYFFLLAILEAIWKIIILLNRH